MERRVGRLVRCLEVRADCSEWEVDVSGRLERAVAFTSLCGPLAPGQEVLLNTTAAALGLGTGGAHFIISALEPGEPEAFPGREAGHILKVRYTPLQHRVCAVEEEGSPHRERVAAFTSLEGTPVLAAELHSQAAAAALAAHGVAPGLRIVWVQADTAALPLALSRTLARLRSDGVIQATVSTGQGFGGDLEAVNLHSGLIAAREAAGADLILVSQGPGNVGTGSEFGFSGLSMAEALHAAASLGGAPILAPRMSGGDPRERHRGLSHHTRTLLRRCLHVPVDVPVPAAWLEAVREELNGALVAHRVVAVDEAETLANPACYDLNLRTMGRTAAQDRLFFEAAAGAGAFAARSVRGEGGL